MKNYISYVVNWIISSTSIREQLWSLRYWQWKMEYIRLSQGSASYEASSLWTSLFPSQKNYSWIPS
jgi:hypothetical protein